MKRDRYGFTLIELLVVISIIALLIGILLPALAAARIVAQRMRSTHRVSEITTSLITYAQSNRGHYPGLDGKGELLTGPEIAGSNTGGAYPEARYAILLGENYFTGEFCISPLETKTAWTTTNNPITMENFSFALPALDLDDDDIKDSTARASEWRENFTTQAPAIGDRNTGLDASSNIRSIHTDPGDWRGSLAWNDGHAAFETQAVQTTRLGRGATVTEDNLFDEDNDNSGDPDNDAAFVYQDNMTLVGQN